MRNLRKIVIGITGVLLTIFLVFYLKVRVYDFPEPQPFSGPTWYNPYPSLQDTLLRANFHAHTFCWGGLTNGEDSEEAMHAAYKAEGYAVAGISNYHSICRYPNQDAAFVPIYEHGLNTAKIHTLAIGAGRVARTFFPVHFTSHQKQQEIDAVARVSQMAAIAHPTVKRYPADEIINLSGYQLMEMGHSTGIEEAQWDRVLSAGRLVWVLCNDDTHSLADEPPFQRWSRIYCREVTSHAVLDALRNGNHYGVWAYDEQCEDNRITQFRITGDTLSIAMRDTANRIDLIGQDGVQKATIAGSDRIQYVLQPDDTYVRSEVHHDHGIMYLNPVIRYDGTLPRSGAPPTNGLLTWLARVLVFILLAAVVLATRSALRKK